ncbi:MAG: uroporphyrinogen-III synthase [Spirosomaceae bacterium]|jgi:uroporphyrinogen-III synthase|nr:uroporphyrinogen-III synthase [Spirosomataceae bacterium]
MSETAEKIIQDRLRKVESILVTQARPTDEKSPYFELARKHNIKVDFRSFIDIKGLDHRDFRKQKIDILAHTAVIFTSRNAVDNFFRICKEMRIEVPADMKYFCISEQTANYLQKYIVIRKRKLFTGQKTAADLENLILKHKSEKFLFPCSNIRSNEIPNLMNRNDLHLTEAIMYETVPADLSDLTEVFYDVICFFSPSGVTSLLHNFPNWKQNNTRLAAFGPTTAKAIRDQDLILDIEAPLPNAPSMTGALELYVKKANNL